MLCVQNKPMFAVYDNSLEAFVPEQWANESIAILLENMVAANLVHRDFEMLFQKYGDVVNTRKPQEFTAQRKGVNDDVVVQAAEADNVAVVLDQHVHVSFLIRDGEETKSFMSLVDEFLRPAAIAMARIVDRIVLGQVYQFLQNSAGALGGLTSSNGPTYITSIRKVFNNNKVPTEGRNLVLTSNSDSLMLQNAIFIQANTVGDLGGAMAEASLGRKFGFDLWMDQNMASVPAQSLVSTETINNGNLTPGSTVITLDDTGGTPVPSGSWVTINGIPYHVIASDGTTCTLEYGLRDAIMDGDSVKVYPQTTVSADYATGYAKYLTVASTTDLSVGQMVTLGLTGTDRYSIVDITGSTILLDRPLAVGVSNTNKVSHGPSGDFNFALHKNSLSLVIRPLMLPRAGLTIAGLASFNGVAMRTVITYDGNKQGHLVTLDFLAGVKVLDLPLGGVMFS